ncbi:POK7 protein, partial [Origma solitaria]|nr:POK7 protein [Origma solitaria]
HHVEKHLYGCFTALGVPLEIKTDNGPVYISLHFARFCYTWGIKHATGAPHNPTGQAIVECANQT